VETGGRSGDAIGKIREAKPGQQAKGEMTTITEHRRTAYCECGAQLAGDTDAELFAAAERHLARHHPQLLGALEPDVVHHMAEDVGAT
jgi:hypothetical protein